MKKTYSVAVLTSVHKRFDTRIWHKQISSMIKEKQLIGSINYYVMDGQGDQKVDGVQIIDHKFSKYRLIRILLASLYFVFKVRFWRFDIVHVHDPELLPFAYFASFFVRTTVYDAHEDIFSTILARNYLPKVLRPVVKTIVASLFKLCLKRLNLVAATDAIFSIMDAKSKVTVKNYAIIEGQDESKFELSYRIKTKLPPRYVVFHGGITAARGAQEMLEAIELCEQDVFLVLAGVFRDRNLEAKILASKKVIFLGWIDFNDTAAVLSGALAGIVIYQPDKNHCESEPNKIFEYMAAGIPIICSDFQHWKNIVCENNVGIAVNPTDSVRLAKAIDWMAVNHTEVKEMGRNSSTLAHKRFSWQSQINNLRQLYEKG